MSDGFANFLEKLGFEVIREDENGKVINAPESDYDDDITDGGKRPGY